MKHQIDTPISTADKSAQGIHSARVVSWETGSDGNVKIKCEIKKQHEFKHFSCDAFTKFHTSKVAGCKFEMCNKRSDRGEKAKSANGMKWAENVAEKVGLT